MGTPSTPAAARKMESPAELAAFVNAVLAEGHAYNPEQRRQATSRLMRAFTDYKSNPAFTPHLCECCISICTLRASMHKAHLNRPYLHLAGILQK